MKTAIQLLYGVLAMAAVSVGEPAFAIAYQVTDLGSLGGRTTTPMSLNNAGVVVGASKTSPTTQYDSAFIWANGSMAAIDSLGGIASAAKGINESGAIVGKTFSAPTVGSLGYVAQNGVTQLLDLNSSLSGGNYDPTAISDNGIIVGMYDLGLKTRSFLYQNGAATDIGVTGFVNAVNNAGQAVGYDYNPTNDSNNAYIYANGALTYIGLGGKNSWAHGINENGQVVGGSSTGGNLAEHAFIYSSTGIVDIGALFPQANSLAFAINEVGQVVGYTYGTQGNRAFLYDAGQFVDLTSLIGDPNWIFEDALAINDLGWIVGEGLYKGTRRGFLLADTAFPTNNPVPPEDDDGGGPHPVALPGTMPLLGIAACGLLFIGLPRRRLSRSEFARLHRA